MSTRVVWTVQVLMLAGVAALIALGMLLGAIGIVVATVLLGVYIDKRGKARRRQAFTAEFGTVAQIRQTHDLDRFRRIESEQGRVHAVREVRRSFPGISLTDAVHLLDG